MSPASTMIEINVPNGRYQSVSKDNTIPKVLAHGLSNQNTATNTSHAIPYNTKTGPSLKTSTPVNDANDAHGPGFSGPMYLPFKIT